MRSEHRKLLEEMSLSPHQLDELFQKLEDEKEKQENEDIRKREQLFHQENVNNNDQQEQGDNFYGLSKSNSKQVKNTSTSISVAPLAIADLSQQQQQQQQQQLLKRFTTMECENMERISETQGEYDNDDFLKQLTNTSFNYDLPNFSDYENTSQFEQSSYISRNNNNSQTSAAAAAAVATVKSCFTEDDDDFLEITMPSSDFYLSNYNHNFSFKTIVGKDIILREQRMQTIFGNTLFKKDEHFENTNNNNSKKMEKSSSNQTTPKAENSCNESFKKRRRLEMTSKSWSSPPITKLSQSSSSSTDNQLLLTNSSTLLPPPPPIKDDDNTTSYPEIKLMIIKRETNECKLKNLEREWQSLQIQYLKLKERKMALSNQQRELLNKTKGDVVINRAAGDGSGDNNGILWTRKKNNENRIKLKDVPRYYNVNNLNINSENALNIHFKIAETTPVVNTKDGAVIIPNSDDFIGFNEIEFAFNAMPGIDPKLIPPGWIENHFKWIVCKLVHYFNYYPDLKECLTLENVIQQLKYRYVRDINRAERSALRKIIEGDDNPKKRLILFISEINEHHRIIKVCDGWYQVHAEFDEPLWNLINEKKITIGTKIITCGADLLMPPQATFDEYCHPLQTSADLIQMQIHYNSTKKAKWWAKLGHQELSEPIPMSLNNISLQGGPIGCIKVCILKMYPIMMETQEQGKPPTIVWRNNKANEQIQTEWKHECIENFETTTNRHHQNNNYTNENKRDAVLKLLLIDAIDGGGGGETKMVFLLSNIQQYDLKTLKEGFLYKIYNVIPTTSFINNNNNNNIELSSCRRTLFNNLGKCDKFSHYESRSYIPISEIGDKNQSEEFNTVGIIVQFSIHANCQHLWLTDCTGRLLNVKISEGVETCALLNDLKRKQIVALSNLLFYKNNNGHNEQKNMWSTTIDFVQSSANQFSIISPYPIEKHLQEAIRKFNIVVESKDIDKLMQECDKKISLVEKPTPTTSSSSGLAFTDSDDAIDAALSLMDIDNLVFP